MTRTIQTEATFHSKKIDNHNRTIYTFEIPDELFIQLNQTKNQVIEALGIDDSFHSPFWSSSLKIEKENSQIDDLLDTGAAYIKFSRHTISSIPQLQQGKKYNIVFDMRTYRFGDRYGLSVCLKAIN